MSNYLKVGAESTYGDGCVAPTGCLFTSIKEDIDRGVMVEKTTDLWLPQTIIGGALGISGSLEMNLRPNQCKPLMTALLGDYTAGAEEDTLVFGEPSSVQFSVGESIGGVSKQVDYVGVGIKSAEFTFNAKEFVTVNFSWFAQKYTDGSYAVPTYVTEDPVTFYTAKLKIDGAQTYEIKSMNMTIDRHLNEDAFVIGDFRTQYLGVTDNSEITGSITLREANTTEVTKAINGATTTNGVGSIALEIECVDLSGTVVMTITLPVTIYTKYGKNSSGRAEVEKTLDFQVAHSDEMKITYPPTL